MRISNENFFQPHNKGGRLATGEGPSPHSSRQSRCKDLLWGLSNRKSMNTFWGCRTGFKVQGQGCVSRSTISSQGRIAGCNLVVQGRGVLGQGQQPWMRVYCAVGPSHGQWHGHKMCGDIIRASLPPFPAHAPTAAPASGVRSADRPPRCVRPRGARTPPAVPRGFPPPPLPPPPQRTWRAPGPDPLGAVAGTTPQDLWGPRDYWRNPRRTPWGSPRLHREVPEARGSAKTTRGGARRVIVAAEACCGLDCLRLRRSPSPITLPTAHSSRSVPLVPAPLVATRNSWQARPAPGDTCEVWHIWLMASIWSITITVQ